MPRVIFRGCSTKDPAAVGYIEQSILFKHFKATPTLIGKNSFRGDGGIVGRSQIRYKIDFECLSFSRTVQNGVTQPYGAMLRWIEQVLTAQYTYIVAAYEGYEGEAVLRRSDYDYEDLSVTTFTDSFWNQRDSDPPGRLPVLVKPEGDLDPQYASGSLYSLSGTLLCAELLQPHV